MSSETTVSEKPGEKPAGKTERREARFHQRAAKKAGKAAEGGKADRPLHLCSLATVYVRKSIDGYQIGITSSDARRTFSLVPDEVDQVLKDLETAILVIRSQQ